MNGRVFLFLYVVYSSFVGVTYSQAISIFKWAHSILSTYDEPEYLVIQNITDNIQERLYEPSCWVCTEDFSTPGRYDRRSSRLTNLLLSYRQGQNDKGVNLPITIPIRTKVDHRNGDLNSYEMCYYLPKVYQSDTDKPKPLNPKVKTVNELKTLVYSLSFNGYPTELTFREKMIELSNILKVKGLKFYELEFGPRAVYFTNVYDSQSKFWNRRNEVWLLSNSTITDN